MTAEIRDTSAAAILRGAASIIDQRAASRDLPEGERSMWRTVKAFWELHGPAILKRGYMLESEGWTFMEILKMARASAGSFNGDDFDDKVAYSALSAEAAFREQAPILVHGDAVIQPLRAGSAQLDVGATEFTSYGAKPQPRPILDPKL